MLLKSKSFNEVTIVVAPVPAANEVIADPATEIVWLTLAVPPGPTQVRT